MTSAIDSHETCFPTRIVSGAIHHVDPAQTLHVHGKKNEWDVVANAFRRYLAGDGVAQDHFHFTEAPGMCPLATPVDFTIVRAIAYQCGLPVAGEPTSELEVVRITLAAGDAMFFLAAREQAAALTAAWTAHQAGAAQERFAWGASIHTGNLLRRTWLLVAFERIQALDRSGLDTRS